MIYASPLATAAEIQALLATDDVTLSGGSQYNWVSTQGANNGLALKVPVGRVLDGGGAVANWAGIIGQTLDTDQAGLIGYAGTAGGVVRNLTLRADASRLVPGARANCSNALFVAEANGIAFNGLLEDLTLLNAPAQAIKLNNINGLTMRRIKTPRPTALPPASGVYLGHYIDLDVTANDRLTQAIVVQDCDLDSYGQECFKAENCTNLRLRGTRFRNYVTLANDVTPYSYMSDIEFDSMCRFDSFIILGNLRRRAVAGVADNLGPGTVVIRGRFVGDDALIYGAHNTVGDTDANQFSGLSAEYCSFEGGNSHFVPVVGSAWITKSSGVKQKVRIYVRQSSSAQYPFPVAACVVAGAVPQTTIGGVVTSAITAANVAQYDLANRGVTVDIAAGTFTGAANLGSNWGTAQNVPMDFVGAGSAKTIFDAQGGATSCLVISDTNTQKRRIRGVKLANAAGTARGWWIASATADVELYDVLSDNCSCVNGGAGGRAQTYAAVYLGPGVLAQNCAAAGTSHGGGFLLNQSGTSVVTVEGARSVGCASIGGFGGAMRIESPFAVVKSFEEVNCTSAGGGGISVSWGAAGVTQTLNNISGRGNVGALGVNDLTIACTVATGKVVLGNSVLGSGGICVSKTGAGDFDYGKLNLGLAGTVSATGGTNTNTGGNQSSDPQFVADTTSVELQSTSPCKGVGSPSWTPGTTRPTLAHDGKWFPMNAANLTTIGARP